MFAIPIQGGLRLVTQGADLLTISLVNKDEEIVDEFQMKGDPRFWGFITWTEISRWFCWRGIGYKFARFRNKLQRLYR